MQQYTQANRANWNERTPYHERSDFYNLEAFRKGALSLTPIEREELGDVSSRSLLHLQCHFGMDTLSWARLGASVTGVDISDKAIKLARTLAREQGIDARFVCSDIYELRNSLDGEFDIVYTSYGVLCWLGDLDRWARIAASYVKPGGTFYIAENHPFVHIFEPSEDGERIEPRNRYFHDPEPEFCEPDGTYADLEADIRTSSYQWRHHLGEIVTVLASAGLRIEFLHEFPYMSWNPFPAMERDEQGLWRMQDRKLDLPLTFSLKATRR